MIPESILDKVYVNFTYGYENVFPLDNPKKRMSITKFKEIYNQEVEDE